MSLWDMSDRQARRWARTRQLGRMRYVLLYGVLFWGGLSGVLAAVLSSLFHDHRSLVHLLSTNLVVFPLVGGIFWGPVVWSIAESQYERWQHASRERQGNVQ